MRPSALQVTYLDQDLMIYRDSKGFADVMWRAGPRVAQRVRAGVSAPAPTLATPMQPEPEPKVDDSQVPTNIATHLSGKIDDLTGVLREQLLQAARDGKEHQQLTTKALELEES